MSRIRRLLTIPLVGLCLLPERLESRVNACDADFDRSGYVDFKDFVMFAKAFGGNDPLYDINRDGFINFSDLLDFSNVFENYVLSLGEIGGLHYLWWDFGFSKFKNMEFNITIHNEPTNKDGLYFQMYQGFINNTGFYFGLQTDVFKPNVGSTGKGLIFSRWGTRDTSNVRPVEGGFSQSSGHEGDFVGIRKNYEWKTGSYKLELGLTESDSIGDWYGVWITDLEGLQREFIGDMRFPLTENKNNKNIANKGGTWTELYSKEDKETTIPEWHVSVDSIFANGRKPVSVDIDYSKINGTNIHYDPINKVIHLLMGPKVRRESGDDSIIF